MAPEVRSGRGADRRSDLYAVGVMAYTLLTGEKPLGMAKPASQLVKGLDRRWDRILGCCPYWNASTRESLKHAAPAPEDAH